MTWLCPIILFVGALLAWGPATTKHFAVRLRIRRFKFRSRALARAINLRPSKRRVPSFFRPLAGWTSSNLLHD